MANWTKQQVLDRAKEYRLWNLFGYDLKRNGHPMMKALAYEEEKQSQEISNETTTEIAQLM